MSKQLLLWGDTQSGKSTLLTTAIFSEEVTALIDIGKSGESLVKNGIYNARRDIEECRLVGSTSTKIDIELVPFSSVGETISVRDIKGGSARDLQGFEFLNEASGFLFVVEWEGPTFQDQMKTVARAVDDVKTKTKLFGLAITKSEKALGKEDPVWMSRGDDEWWKNYPHWNDHKETMRAMGDRIWVTSAYGYHDRRPATLLGEFGEWFPYKTKPINVGQPFAWFFREFAE